MELSNSGGYSSNGAPLARLNDTSAMNARYAGSHGQNSPHATHTGWGHSGALCLRYARLAASAYSVNSLNVTSRLCTNRLLQVDSDATIGLTPATLTAGTRCP